MPLRSGPFLLVAIPLMGLLLGPTSVIAEAPASCAVVTFDAAPGGNKEQATAICNRYAVLLSQTNVYAVMPRTRTQRRLAAGGFRSAAYKTQQGAGLAAGNLLGVDIIIHGQVDKTPKGFVLTTILIDIKAGRALRSMRTRAPNWSTFFWYAPSDNIRHLLKLKKPEPVREPTPIRKPTPIHKPEPVPEPWQPPPPRGQTRAWQQDVEAAWNRFRGSVSDRLEIGTRITAFHLLDSTSPSFVGTINGLAESQSLGPWKIFIDWFFHPNAGGEFMWDYLRVETRTLEGVTDGDWTLSGPVFSAVGRYPNETQWTPYAGLGFALYNAGFDPAAWWHLGFHSPEEWIAEGSPSESTSGLTQTMQPKDPIGFMFQGGCTYEFSEGWLLDLHAHYTHVNIDDFHVLSVEGTPVDQRGTYHIPLSHYIIGIGIRYSFR